MQLDAIRKCDCIYMHDTVLAIFEFKNNVLKKEDAMQYIKDRDYLMHVLSFMKINELNFYNTIKKIVLIGIEFYGANTDFAIKLFCNTVDLTKELEEEIEMKINSLSILKDPNRAKRRKSRKQIRSINNNNKNYKDYQIRLLRKRNRNKTMKIGEKSSV